MKLKPHFKSSVFVIMLLVLFSSCGNKQVYKSISENDMKSEIRYIGFDNQSAIRYAISNDKEFLYIRLEALSRPSVLKIIQSGFYIYIDTLGKRSKEIGFNFPIGETDQLFQAKLFSKGDKENAAEVGKIELESQIRDVGKSATFTSNGNEVSVENDLEKGFAFNLKPGEYGSLNYYAAIRLDKIQKGGLKAMDKLNLGIVSGAFRKPNLAGANNGGGRNRSSSMNRVPQTQQNNVDPTKMRDMYLMSQPISFWVNVELYKK